MIFIGGEPEDPQKLSKHYAEYGEFMKFLMSGSHFKSGFPVNPSDGRMVHSSKVEKDGDFMSTTNRVGGIMVISANDIDHAAEIGRKNPIIKNGGKVLVRPIKEM